MSTRARLPLALAVIMLTGCAVFETKDAAAPATPEDRWATYFGWRVTYTSRGEGTDAIVLVHGWSCDRTVWDRQADALAEQHRVLTVDLLGHGNSDAPQVAYSMDLFAKSVAAAMDEAGVQRAVLVGHSNGTPVIRQFARLFPERTAGLVAVEGALRPFYDDPAEMEAFIAPLRGDDYREHAVDLIDGMLPETMEPERRAALREVVVATPQHVMIGSFEAAADPAIYTDDPITAPLLVVLARSPFWTDEYEAYVRTLAPNVEYVVWDDVTHFLMIDRPDEFNTLLLEFVDRNVDRYVDRNVDTSTETAPPDA